MTLRQAAFVISAVATLMLFSVVAALSGCAEFNAAQVAIADHGAQAADAALRTSKWGVCQATTIGALERDLGGDSTRSVGWLMFCGKKPGMLPLLAPSAPLEPPAPGVKPPAGQPGPGAAMQGTSF
jgi:hypothetical protein